MSSLGHCFDIGNITRKAIESFESNGRIDPLMGPCDERSAGNGSLMRLCPVSYFL